jgi:hypothetical protein
MSDSYRKWAEAPVFVPGRKRQQSVHVRVPIPQVHAQGPRVEAPVLVGSRGFRATAPEFIPSRRHEQYIAWRDTVIQENKPQVVPGVLTGPHLPSATPMTSFPENTGSQYPTKGSEKKAGGVTAIPNPMEAVSAPPALQTPWTPAPSRLLQATYNTTPTTTSPTTTPPTITPPTTTPPTTTPRTNTPPTTTPPTTMDSPTMLTARSPNTSVSTPQKDANRSTEFCPFSDCRWSIVLGGLTPDRRSRVLSDVPDEEIDHILEYHTLQLRPLDLTPEGAAPPLASDAWEGVTPESSPVRGFAGLSTLIMAQRSNVGVGVGRRESVASSVEDTVTGARQTLFATHRERVLKFIGGVEEATKGGTLLSGEEDLVQRHEARPIDMDKKAQVSRINEQAEEVVPQSQIRSRARAYTLVNPPSTSRAASHRRSISIHGKKYSFIFLPFRFIVSTTTHIQPLPTFECTMVDHW